MDLGGEGMEYSVSKLARLSGVSARTLRYYDEIGLLKPKRVNSSGYRIYGAREVDLLQQILFYREMDLSLDEIKQIIYAADFDVASALEEHLLQLSRKKARLEALIDTVSDSLQALKGEKMMTDQERFEAFKKEMIDENEAKYGAEIREKYGEKTINQSNEKFGNMTESQFQEFQALGETLNGKLAVATAEGNPKGALAQEVCALHQEWLTIAWPKGHYSSEKHFNLSLMYVHDERFKDYYEKVAPGAAEFLHEALKIYTGMGE